MNEMNLELENIKSGGMVHLLIQFNPMLQLPKMVFKRLPKFRMQLDRSTYFAGEVIRGFVVYNTYKPIDIRAVRLRVDGYSNTEWTENRTEQRGDETVNYYYHYHTRITFFNTVATLYGNHKGSNKKFTLEPGSYFFPFEYALPLGLPPSYNGAFGCNYYEYRLM